VLILPDLTNQEWAYIQGVMIFQIIEINSPSSASR
jgi:hypothetical protein